MKFRLIYVYALLAVAALAVLLIFTNKTEESGFSGENIPRDSIHKQLDNQPIGKGNISGEFYQEMEILRSDVEKNPSDTAKLKAYADYLTAAHQFDGAIPVYQEILSKDNKRTDVYIALTFIYYSKKDYDKAAEMSNKILSYEKDNLQAMYNLGVMESAKGNKERAKEIWTKLNKEYPNTHQGNLAAKSLQKL